LDQKTGKGLALVISKDEYKPVKTRGISIRRFPPQDEKLGGDVLSLGPNFQADHIHSLSRILTSYVQAAFDYSEKDAQTLAFYILYYNAINRKNLSFFQEKYTPELTKNLSASRVGIGKKYTEWPGKTQIIIPLEKNILKKGDKDVTIDELEKNVNKVIDKNPTAKNLEKKDELEKVIEDKTKDERNKIENKKDEVTKKETNLKDEKSKTDEKLVELQKDPAAKKEDIAKLEDKKKELDKQTEDINKQKKEIAEKDKKIAEKEKELESKKDSPAKKDVATTTDPKDAVPAKKEEVPAKKDVATTTEPGKKDAVPAKKEEVPAKKDVATTTDPKDAVPAKKEDVPTKKDVATTTEPGKKDAVPAKKEDTPTKKDVATTTEPGKKDAVPAKKEDVPTKKDVATTTEPVKKDAVPAKKEDAPAKKDVATTTEPGKKDAVPAKKEDVPPAKKEEPKKDIAKELEEKTKELEEIKKKQAEASEKSANVIGEKILFLQVVKYESDGHYTNDLWVLDSDNEEGLFKSPFENICGRDFVVLPGGVLVIGFEGKEVDNRVHHLVLLDKETLDVKKMSKEDIFWQSNIVYRDNKIYVFETFENKVYLSRFSEDLVREARSSEPVNINSDLTFNKGKIFLTSKLQNSNATSITILNKQDLKVLKTFKPNPKKKGSK
jgi:hypothetical protein